DLDAHGARAGLRNGQLRDLERALRTRDPGDTHRRTHRMPPLMSSVSPVIHAASSEARNTAAGAMSCGWPMRPRGIRGWISLRKSPSMKPPARAPSVSTTPGLIAFTRMLRDPSSAASVRVIESTAALVALYTAEPARPAVLASELMLMTLPPPAPKCFTASL